MDQTFNQLAWLQVGPYTSVGLILSVSINIKHCTLDGHLEETRFEPQNSNMIPARPVRSQQTTLGPWNQPVNTVASATATVLQLCTSCCQLGNTISFSLPPAGCSASSNLIPIFVSISFVYATTLKLFLKRSQTFNCGEISQTLHSKAN